MKPTGRIVRLPEHGFEAEAPSRTHRSFTRKVALRMIAFASCAVAIIAIFSFHVAKREAERALLGEWQMQIEQRGRYESQRLLRAEELTNRFSARFLASYTDPDAASAADFDRYFSAFPDGTIRLRPEFYSGYRDGAGVQRSGATGFVARNQPPLTPELQRRLILAYETVAEFGPGASTDFANVHATLPENALIMHWPNEPWGLKASSDLDMTAKSVVQATLQSNNPSRRPVWTGLYFDATAANWTITFERPLDWQGRHLINPSVDVSVTDLIDDVSSNQPDGIYELLLSRNGMLVAHSTGIQDLPENAGQIEIEELGSSPAADIYRDLSHLGPANDGKATVRFDADLDAYVAGVGLKGPDWWLVTVYPQDLVEARALRFAGRILGIIALLFAAFIATIILVLRGSVAAPIRKITLATQRLASGDGRSVPISDGTLPIDRHDDIGTLARSFGLMASRVEDMRSHLEDAVSERTIELERANQLLAEQSVRDALTGALNRRAFDVALKKAIHDVNVNEAKIALVLFDVDFFKLYNDHYGHVAGDKTLRQIVMQLEASLPTASIYRYGGEEIAAIIPCRDGSEPKGAINKAVKEVEDLSIIHSKSPYGHVTVSGGGMLLSGEAPESGEILESVDRALYSAKKGGRNRFVWLVPEQA
ncbi:response regulator [Pacificimonas flava]|uniref:diguanylate cyclase n=2 Tax=Pacificimonas flava TaxID=1234595 RepID=M2U1B9_9SPHN|nr:response regulator [Pacificimonas flava]